MTTPLVSILVPSYNYGHFIARCVESVLAQTYADWELIVCDDQSKDDSWAVLSAYTEHPNVRLYRNEQNQGLYENVVHCIDHARGDYLKILMADDWLHPDYLSETMRMFEQHPTIALCSVRTEVVHTSLPLRLTRMEPEQGRVFYPAQDILGWTTRHVNPIGNPSRVIFRRAAYGVAGGFDLSIEYCTEYDLWIRMLEHGDFACVPHTLSYEQLHERNATKDYASRGTHILEAEKMFSRLFQHHPFYHGDWKRQQAVWLFAIEMYWDAALRHLFDGNAVEFKTLIGVLFRRSWLPFWLPLMVYRFTQVAFRKVRLKTLDIVRARRPISV